MTASPYSVALGDGRTFVSTMAPTTGPLRPMAEACVNHLSGHGPCGDGEHTTTEQSTLRFLSDLWSRAKNGKRSEHARLTMIEQLFRGIHYRDVADLKRLEVTNFCFSNVETVAGLLNRAISMPRLAPSKPMDAAKAEKIKEFADYLQRRTHASNARRKGNRVKAKYGYTIHLITVDAGTGMPYVVEWSDWDWYPDPSGKNVPACEYFCFAGPVSTRKICALFPGQASRIRPDSFVSPAYDVCRRIDEQLYQDHYARNTNIPAITNDASTAPYKGATQPTGSTTLAADHSGWANPGSDTTFLFQFLVRDRTTTQPYQAMGNVMEPDPNGMEPLQIPGQHHTFNAPACAGGWRLYMATQDCLLTEEPLDEAFGGLNFVVEYHQQNEEKIEGSGAIERSDLLDLA